MIIGTAGHIDHGKTTLVKALTGIDCDRWQEEKERGITLDLGYAFVPLGNHAAGTLGFIDVPGHEKLIHNMLAGATGIDFVLLVVAADDGPMPQTREHLEIIELLGIRRGAVALTKTGLVDADRLATATEETRALLAATPLATAPVFPVDAVSGDGILQLRTHLEAAAHQTGERAARGRFRLAIDRAFTLGGVGTVVTGTAFSGHVRSGEHLTLSPTGQTARVRSLRVQGQPAESGHAGQRIALALAGIEKSAVTRGMWALAPELHHPQRCFAVMLKVLSSQPPIAHWAQVHCHLGADDIPARVSLLEGETLAPGQTALAELVLERDTSVLAGDRFILRDAMARHTVGGGEVVDIFPPTRKKRSPERLALLRAQVLNTPAAVLTLAIEQQPAGIDIRRFALNLNLAPGEVQQLCSQLRLRQIEDTVLSDIQWQQLADDVLIALAAEHERQPDMPGIEHDRLRRLARPNLPRPVFAALIAEMLARGTIGQTGTWLHLPEHRIQLAAHDREMWASLRPLLDTEPFNPPRVREVANGQCLDEEKVRSLMKRVARIGEIYPVAHDHYFTADAVSTLARHVAELCAEDGFARAARLRDRIGGGRKVAIHILEFFDRIGYTRRVRDAHGLRQIDGQPIRPFK